MRGGAIDHFAGSKIAIVELAIGQTEWNAAAAIRM